LSLSRQGVAVGAAADAAAAVAAAADAAAADAEAAGAPAVEAGSGTAVLVVVLMVALWAYLNNFPKY
jgi:hypothetical protein